MSLISSIASLLSNIRARGDASQQVAAKVDEALKDAPVIVPAPPERVKETPKPLHVPETGKGLPASFNLAAFFDHIRPMFGGRLTQRQVEGCEAILMAMRGDRVSWCAYALATAFHETGRSMAPNAENLNYSVQGLLNTFGRHRISEADARRLGRKPGEPALSKQRQREIANIIYGGEWGRRNLGNTMPDDGWTYRGRGMAHDTGRRNYKASGEAVGVDLLAEPGALLQTDLAALVMATGMRTGRYTTHSLERHLSSLGAATEAQFIQARRIINSLDKAAEIAAHAMRFQQALIAAGWRG